MWLCRSKLSNLKLCIDVLTSFRCRVHCLPELSAFFFEFSTKKTTVWSGFTFAITLCAIHLGKKTTKEIVCLMLAGSQICLGFKEHGLITCESKVQVEVVVSLGS